MNQAKPMGPPPSLSRNRLRNSWQMMTQPTAFYTRWFEALGDTFTVPTMNGDIVCTCHPAGAKAIFSLKDDPKIFGVEIAAPLLGQYSMLALHGPAHHRERKVLMPAFHGPRMKAYGDDIRRIAREQFATWTPAEPLVMYPEMSEITFRIMVHAVFGVEEPERAKTYLHAIRHLMDSLNPAYLFFRFLQHPWVPGWRRFLQAKAAVDALIYEDLAARRATGPVTEETAGHDVLSMMLAARYDDGSGLCDEAIRDELLTLLFAGVETTAIALSWSIFRLGKHPQQAAWLRDGLARAKQEGKGAEACPEMRAFWQEALRLTAIVPDIVRDVGREVHMHGTLVPAACKISVVGTVIHRRADLYPDPDAFKPQRFVDKRPSPFEFMAFGGGSRRCVGAALAAYEIELVLEELLTFLGDRPWRLLSDDVEARRSITLAPSEGVRVQLDR